MALIHKDQGTLTTIAGSANVTIGTPNTVLYQLFMSPTTATTTYDVSLTDIYGRVVFSRDDNQGEMNEGKILLPSYGRWTLAISNASADEPFDYLLVYNQS